MATRLVKLRLETYDPVKALSAEYGMSMQEVVAGGVEALERQEFARAFQSDFAALRADPEAWQAELSERMVLDATSEDGIE